MRQIREILRLKYESRLPHRAIARSCGLGAGTVSDTVSRARRAGVGWPLPAGVDDAELEARLYPTTASGRSREMPEMVHLHEELKRPGVTLQLLWVEYIRDHPDGYRYSQFCKRYRRWARRLSPSMRQVHRAGEKAFVDYAGQKPAMVDRRTGEVIPVELFVSALGASSYIYALATESQRMACWVEAHVGMVEFFGGCPEVWVPDCLKSAVTKACRYEPMLNRTYEDLAAHYGAVIVPARPYRAKDKPKVEVGVQVVERWILAALRNRTFFGLAEMNAAIAAAVSTPTGQVASGPESGRGQSRTTWVRFRSRMST